MSLFLSLCLSLSLSLYSKLLIYLKADNTAVCLWSCKKGISEFSTVSTHIPFGLLYKHILMYLLPDRKRKNSKIHTYSMFLQTMTVWSVRGGESSLSIILASSHSPDLRSGFCQRLPWSRSQDVKQAHTHTHTLIQTHTDTHTLTTTVRLFRPAKQVSLNRSSPDSRHSPARHNPLCQSACLQSPRLQPDYNPSPVWTPQHQIKPSP